MRRGWIIVLVAVRGNRRPLGVAATPRGAHHRQGGLTIDSAIAAGDSQGQGD